MDELVGRYGNDEGLLLEVHWEDTSSRATAAQATWGELRLLIQGEVVWQGADPSVGFSWTWIELLEFLAVSWPFLEWEDGFPLGLRPGTPSQVRAQVDDRWEELAAPLREEEEEEFERFEEYHDLARALQGAVLAPVWIIREGNGCWVSGGGKRVYRSLGEVLSTLSQVAEAILERIVAIEDDRGHMSLEAWQERSYLPLDTRVSIATGLREDQLEAVKGERGWEETWEVSEDDFDLNELMAAARMAATLPPAELARVVNAVRAVPHISTPKLDLISGAASEVMLEMQARRPYDQGHALAGWLRTQPDVVSEQGRVDPGALLEAWEVPVSVLDPLAEDIDAVACWGPLHGPAVLVNPSGSHNSSPGGRRATYAHEIAHLLIDRHDALPLAEVLGGRSSPVVEARARAFAAELLLPRAVAGKVMASAGSDPQLAMYELQETYGVSQELVAWQARNSEESLPTGVTSFLRNKVSRRWLF